MSKLLNPYSLAHRQLGKTDEEWDALKVQLIDFLKDSPSATLIASMRAVNIEFDDDQIWRQISGELGLTMELPE